MPKNAEQHFLNSLALKMPFISSLILSLLSYIPLSSDIASYARPYIGLMCVYFWLVYRPDLFNLFSVFFLGLIIDVISISPIGTNTMMFLFAYAIISFLRKYMYQKIFILLWLGIIVLLPICLAFKWLCLSLYHAEALGVKMLFFSYLSSVAAYPLLSVVNAYILNTVLRRPL